MGYETPISVKELVEGINKKYYLPSIQREFVWETDRIAKLFDSLMQGFPIGSFLFWEVPKDKIEEFSFYKFMETFHALNDTHNKPAHLLASDFPVTAILDGQQRMTSLYIGLMGTYAEKLKYKRKNDGTAYPDKKLYLNLMNKLDANTSNNKLELTYAFKFLEPFVVEKANKSDKEHWFEVGKILKSEFADPYGIICYLAENNLTNHKYAGKILSELKKNIWDNKPISFYLEKSTDLNTVVNIFIRVNSGGLVLTEAEEVLFDKKISAEDAKNILAEMNRTWQDISISYYTGRRWITEKIDVRIQREMDNTGASVELGNFDELLRENLLPNKIFIRCESPICEEMERELGKKFPSLNVVRSAPYLLEIIDKSVSKATGIEVLLKHYGYSLDEAVAFGDNYNDIEMLKLIPQSVAMENSPDAIKKLAFAVTDSNEVGGIYTYLVKIGLID